MTLGFNPMFITAAMSYLQPSQKQVTTIPRSNALPVAGLAVAGLAAVAAIILLKGK